VSLEGAVDGEVGQVRRDRHVQIEERPMVRYNGSTSS
jgi:hypothetical protein